MINRSKIIIWGASGHAFVVSEIARLVGYDIVGFIDDISLHRIGEYFSGAKILGGREQLHELLLSGVSKIFLGFGNCQMRLEIGEYVRREGFDLVTLIHPTAVISTSAVIGDGTLVGACAVVNAEAQIGENTIINTSAIVEHECVIRAGVHVSPGACLGGKVYIGRASWIGIGAVVKDSIRIGSETIVGAGAVVVRDIPDKVIAYGNPARVKRSNNL